MSKQIISTEAQILLKLLRLALGTESRRYFGEPLEPSCGELAEPFPANINWKEVIRLSYKHKVSALAVDGLKSSGYDIYFGLNDVESRVLKDMVEAWFDDVARTELCYAYYVETVCALSQVFKAYGLIPIVLKGYGLSLCYPVPSHRGAGDIDVYLIDKDGNAAGAVGDRIAKDVLGLEVREEGNKHHSSFVFKNILVENHYDMLGTNWGGERERKFGIRLSDMIGEGCLARSGVTLPSSTFNAIYLIQHSFSHIAWGGFTLRQLADYAVFRQGCYDDVDWARVWAMLDRYGLGEFARAYNDIAGCLLGMSDDVGCLSTLTENDFTKHLLSDMFCFNYEKMYGVRFIGHYYRHRWHYKYFSNVSWMKLSAHYLKLLVLKNIQS